MTACHVPELLNALHAAGVTVTLNAVGDGLTLSGRGRPPADLLEVARQSKPDILAFLHGGMADSAGAVEAPHVFPSPVSVEEAGHVSETKTAPEAPRPDWAVIAAQTGRCGSCARWRDAAHEWGSLMGTCGCGPTAFPVGGHFLAIHAGHRCVAYEGRGYRPARVTQPRPVPEDSAGHMRQAVGL